MNKTFRESAIDYIQNKHLCKGYVDYIVSSLNKLEQIEQIYSQWSEIGDNADSWAFKEIREVIENG